MSQTEMMIRLLKDGKIVGREYKMTTCGETITSRKEINGLAYLEGKNIDHDSFELGIKQDNGEWFFEGDILTDTIFGYEVFVLHYHNGAFCYNRPIDRDFAHSIKTLDDVFEWKCLGNIHENPELINQ